MHSEGYELIDWLQAKEESSRDPDFDHRVNRKADKKLSLVPPEYIKDPKKARKALIEVTKIEYRKRRAYFIWVQRNWIKECAYFLSLKNPDNSAYANWCQAALEYDNLRSK
jgi:hypothetical protein